VPDDPPAPPDTRLILFDSTPVTFANWQVLGGGAFQMVEGLIVTEPGNDLGLCYYAARPFADFILQLQFRLERGDENSGVWVRSRDPRRPVPDRNDPNRTHAYDNPAYVPVDTGFEIQIDELARGNPLKGTVDGAEAHRTGAIYDVPTGPAAGQQRCARAPGLQPGTWNDYLIEVRGDRYRVELNGYQTALFTNTDAFRGRPATRDPHSGYVGLQSHTGHVAFRNISVVILDSC
jgi:hypothetical protein